MAASMTKTIKKVTYTPNDSSDLVVGSVTSASPLKIKVGSVEYSKTFLILSPFCIQTSVDIHHSHKYTDDGATRNTSVEQKKVLLWRGLKKGDTVYMIKCNGGQLYYVLQRKEGVMIQG